MLADVLTMIEHTDKPLEQIAYCYIGDARNNMGHSLMLVGCILGMDVRICSPASLAPDRELAAIARDLAEKSGARLTITDDVAAAVKGVDYVHTDVWVSMGEPAKVWDERIKLLKPVSGQRQPDATHRQSKGQVHALPARLPQP
jgi:ornithine carbamoyltransferase